MMVRRIGGLGFGDMAEAKEHDGVHGLVRIWGTVSLGGQGSEHDFGLMEMKTACQEQSGHVSNYCLAQDDLHRAHVYRMLEPEIRVEIHTDQCICWRCDINC